MSNVLKLRRGNSAQTGAFTGALSEVTHNTDDGTLHVHDGSTPGGIIVQSPLNQRLLQWAYAQSFCLVSATRDANEAIVTASIVWPDGATGTFTTDSASTAFPGAIDAWHATYVNGPITKTVTQTLVTRDTGGGVVAQPLITIQ
ncbi:hypothetical protein [Burkholderia vietnamiensis]|uniref:hyaluronate lyase N-terminal domain-containing protein n=1 Tax=Burkholderia vietnamiensis TaxID=60552 RepID=UPI001B8E9328|nr:hypothetical protein [Burkholderia vietnamiensis]MBR8279805.1 hypothetical protein [Burkholderia vietnamiensis]